MNPSSSGKRWRSRAWVWFAVITGAIVLPFVISWPFGGLAEAKHEPPRLSLGQTVTGHRFQFTLRRAYFTTKNPEYTQGPPGRYLVLVLDVKNVSKQPTDLLQAFIDLQVKVDGKELGAFNVNRYRALRQDEIGTLLNPGLPEQARFSWEVPGEVGDPKKLTMSIMDEVYEPSWSLRGYSSGTSLWYKDKVMGTFETVLEHA
ncbi:hypothetical protein [Nonomuraea sp. NPDC049400]|uniref:hypothetical protein n=1 Tax=Nonomuraea sp. NPDC049400 TaxID=3364352 RepID=UPI0037B364AA